MEGKEGKELKLRMIGLTTFGIVLVYPRIRKLRIPDLASARDEFVPYSTGVVGHFDT